MELDEQIRRLFFEQNIRDKQDDDYPYNSLIHEPIFSSICNHHFKVFTAVLQDKKSFQPLAIVHGSIAPEYHNFIIIQDNYKEKFKPLVESLNEIIIHKHELSFSDSYISIPSSSYLKEDI